MLDLYLPSDPPGPHPCIVAIHGGGFISALGLPPFLIQHGSDDDLVPVEQSMLLARALRGVMRETDVRFDVIPGSLHGGPAFETEENMARVFAFLSAALGPSGKALDKAS